MGLTPEQGRKLGLQVETPTIRPELREAIDSANAQLRGEKFGKPEVPAQVLETTGKPRQDPGPTEEEEQRALAAALAQVPGLLWCHVPNGGIRQRGAAGALKAQGLQPGVPDVLIFTPPPRVGGVVGVALELKRASARPHRSRTTRWPSCVRPEQCAWLEGLEECGWHSLLAFGAADALQQLADLGYGVR